MNNEIKESLTMICEIYRNELENIITQINGTTSGTCYLSGYTLTSVFQKMGFKSTETTGVLYIKKPDGEQLIYGGDELGNRGKLVGYYHTWCVVEIDDNKIIIDPSMKYLKEYLIENKLIKPRHLLPENVVIFNSNSFDNIRYVKEDNLIPTSKKFLNMINEELKQLLIHNVFVESNNLFDL